MELPKDLAEIIETIMDADLKEIWKTQPDMDVQLLLNIQTVRSTNKMINAFSQIRN